MTASPPRRGRPGMVSSDGVINDSSANLRYVRVQRGRERKRRFATCGTTLPRRISNKTDCGLGIVGHSVLELYRRVSLYHFLRRGRSTFANAFNVFMIHTRLSSSDSRSSSYI